MYERYWMVKVTDHGFKFSLCFFGKENDLPGYLETELACYEHYTYCGASRDEVDFIRNQKLPIYMI